MRSLALFLGAVSIAFWMPSTEAQERRVPTATLVSAPSLPLPGGVDSNSPAVWDLVNGRRLISVFTSIAGKPSLAMGTLLSRMGPAMPVTFVPHPGHGVWMEAVVIDEGDTWYGYYHNEVPAEFCGRPNLVMPRIGAARSRNRGRTWEDLGIVLEAPPGWYNCATQNRYFVGGVGDLSVMLDQDSTDLYLFFSQYSRYLVGQGVGVARLQWADRDEPVGRISIWSNGVWQPNEFEVADDESQSRWVYPSGTPLVRTREPWHDSNPENDAFWGPSVHWNAHLRQYVMLLNRTKDEQFGQEGIYVSFSPSLDNPALWSPPQRILAGGTWYPQVMGLDTGEGTDKQAGARARFFMGGTSNHFIDFSLP